MSTDQIRKTLKDALEVVELAWDQKDLRVLEGLAFNVLPQLRALVATTGHACGGDDGAVWPIVNVDVDGDGRVTGAKVYAPGLPAGNHDVYPVRVPYLDEHTEAWLACVAALEAARPGFMQVGKSGIEAAVLTIQSLASPSRVDGAGE